LRARSPGEREGGHDKQGAAVHRCSFDHLPKE
jgi:hypothetical protein